MAIFSKDAEKILRVLRDINVTPLYLDNTGLKNQLEEILAFYIGRSLGELNLSQLLGDIFELLYRHNIPFPPDLLVVAKALTTLENIGSRLDPSFEPLQRIRPYLVRRYIDTVKDPKWHSFLAAETTSSYRLLLRDLPIDFRTLLRAVARQDFTLHTATRNFNEVKEHQNRVTNRVLTAVAGFVFLGSGLYASTLPPSPIISPLSYALLGLSAVLLLLTWRSISKSGGSH